MRPAETGRMVAASVRLPAKPEVRQAPPLSPPGDDFLRYFAAVVRGELRPSGLSSLKNNLVVTEILDAARRSAATGSTVRLTLNDSRRGDGNTGATARTGDAGEPG